MTQTRSVGPFSLQKNKEVLLIYHGRKEKKIEKETEKETKIDFENTDGCAKMRNIVFAIVY